MTTRRALAFSFLDRYASLVLNIGSSMFIARLLTPAEIGVFSVTMVLVAFVMSLRDLGAGQYLIQEKDLTRERIRAAWTVSLGTGFIAGAAVAAAAWPVAAFYKEPRMVKIMLVIAVNFAVNPFGSLTYAWLMREMRFDALALMRFLANLAGACATVYLAWSGWGPISLAFGTLLSTIVNGLVAAYFRPKSFPIIPGFVGIGKVVSVGSKFSANGLLAVMGGSVSELTLGKLQSLADAALYSRANGLASMFQRMVLDALNVVAIPMFAREARERGDINASFLRTVSYTTALGWSFFLALTLLAFPAIRVLYGFQWNAAADATRLIALAYLIAVTSSMCPVLLMAIGAAGTMVRTAAVTVVIQIAAISIGATVSLNATALAFVVSSTIGIGFWLRATQRALQFEWKSLAHVLFKSGTVALITGLAPLCAVAAFGWEPVERVAPLASAMAGGAVLFVIAVRLTRHPLSAELSRLWQQVPKIRQ